MFCKKCGAQLSKDAKFCEKCGTACENITPAPAEAVPVPPPVAPPPTAPMPNYAQPTAPMPDYAQQAVPRKRPVGLIVTIVILSVLLIGGGITTFILLNRNSAPKTVTILGVEYDVATTTKLDLYRKEITDEQLKEIAPEIAKLTHLTELYLDGNKISDITPLAKLTNLTVLGLGGNQISDITLLANFTNLTILLLSENQISDITPLTNLTNLKDLRLSGNQISDSDIESLKSKLPNCKIRS